MREKITVWAGLCGNETLLGRCIFDGIVNGYNYLQMIKNFTFRQLHEHFNNQFNGVFQRLWWFQDGVPKHCLKVVRHRLLEMFVNSIVALSHEVEWPPSSPDMTPCTFFLWGYLKSQVFVTPPNNTQCLRNRIQIELENLSQNPGVIRNTVRSMKKRTRICIEKYGIRVEKNLQK